MPTTRKCSTTSSVASADVSEVITCTAAFAPRTPSCQSLWSTFTTSAPTKSTEDTSSSLTKLPTVRRTAECRMPATLLWHMFGPKEQDDSSLLHWHQVYKSGPKKQTPALSCEQSSDGSTWGLLNCAVPAEGGGGKPWLREEKPIDVLYFNISGPGVKTTTVKEVLENLADFGAVPESKVTDRLELLNSEACTFALPKHHAMGIKLKDKAKAHALFDIHSEQCRVLDCSPSDGCGYIDEDFLVKTLFGNNANAKRLLGIQIRFLAPKHGLFKGLLVRTRLPKGSPPVVLTPKMRKAGPSVTNPNDTRAILLVHRTHPSTNNLMVGRYLLYGTHEDDAKRGATKSSSPCPLDKKKAGADKNMIMRLWMSLGVPKALCIDYAKRSKSWKGLGHAWVAGYADPTHAIPNGTVFVTGTVSELGENVLGSEPDIYVTRSPCLKPEDARLLPVLTERPDRMTEEQWELLTSLPFGAVIFPDAEEGMLPLAAHIADGDVDGDLYFLCWQPDILAALKDAGKVEPVVPTAEPVKPTKTESCVAQVVRNPEWLSVAQQHWVDIDKKSAEQRLISVLYRAAGKVADASEHFLFDPDAKDLANAFKSTLDLKHGRGIVLRSDLHKHVPKDLRRFLTDACK